MFSKAFHHPFPPSCLPILSLSPDRSLLLRWDLEFGTTKFCSLGHTVFPTLQEVSLITPKVEQKYICKTLWTLSPSSFCFILFLVIIKQSIFYFHFLLYGVETTSSDYIYMNSCYYRKLFYPSLFILYLKLTSSISYKSRRHNDSSRYLNIKIFYLLINFLPLFLSMITITPKAYLQGTCGIMVWILFSLIGILNQMNGAPAT